MNPMSPFDPREVGDRKAWMPDPGMYHYVADILRDCGVDPESLPEHVIPLGITGTIEWIFICGWWVWTYTGVFDTDEPYKYVFDYEGYEFSPDKLLTFGENPELNAFEERIFEPGLTEKEIAEAFPYLLNDVFDAWGLHRPGEQIAEVILWATLMWVLSDYGREWLAAKDPIFKDVYRFFSAYISKWDNAQLDPLRVSRTDRKALTCRNCEQELWCVKGFMVDENWFFLCNACADAANKTGEFEMDPDDVRLQVPKCGSETCLYTACAHLGKTREDIIDEMYEWGKERTQQYRDWVQNELGGVHPRKAMGQDVQQIIDHFRKPELEGPS